ncbi:retrovirus-related pol polyprotein from transposon tnt 1-94, partial [Nicotiana attenuata]
SEFEAFMSNKTWDLVPPSDHQNIMENKWIFHIKRKADGSIERYKALLVPKGFTQQPGIDYADTFSPVVKSATIRTVLAIATQNMWPLHQLDINNAFLQGTLTEEVFMKQPKGFENHNYPLHPAHSNHSLFTLHAQDTILFLLVYVDDIVLTGNNLQAIKKFKGALSNHFSLKDLGPLHFFFGIEVVPHPDGLFLSWTKYIMDALQKFSMQECHGVFTPISSTSSLRLNDGFSSTDASQYRSAIGKLQYLAFTRPDICFAVNKLSQFMHQPSHTHWQAVKGLLRCLKSTIHHGRLFCRDLTTAIYVYPDTDWAGD